MFILKWFFGLFERATVFVGGGINRFLTEANGKYREPGMHRSLLEALDLYKLTMLQVIWKYFPNKVKFAFKNRTKKVKVAKYISERALRRRLDNVLGLSFTPSELEWLGTLGLFSPGFLKYLATLQFSDYKLKRVGDDYEIEFAGLWTEATLWETICMAIVAELMGEAFRKEAGLTLDQVWDEGDRRLREKIAKLKMYPELKFTDFGTRRAYSRAWQEHVIQLLMREVPSQLVGTSNLYLAMKYGLKPIGTFAHEMYMGVYGVYRGADRGDAVALSLTRVWEFWEREYGDKLSTLLADQYGDDFTFRVMPDGVVKRWKALRHDSGDPFAFGEKAIEFYTGKGVDPKTKTVVFSDGLDVDTIISLWERFNGRIGVAFGWGTNLTNDMGLMTLSIVIKLVESCGFGTVKLSNNLDKATGTPEDIARVVKEVAYTNINRQECRY